MIPFSAHVFSPLVCSRETVYCPLYTLLERAIMPFAFGRVRRRIALLQTHSLVVGKLFVVF